MLPMGPVTESPNSLHCRLCFLQLKSEGDALWVFSLSTSQKLPELPRSLRSPLEDILRSALQHKMMAATGETAETDRGEGQNIENNNYNNFRMGSEWDLFCCSTGA